MKRILITGANSYIGISFEKWCSRWPDEYSVVTMDMMDGSWRQKSFSGYDVVFHVAGIAHIKETKKNADLYYQVNRDLAFEVAQKAKEEGIKQFIFLSSMSVYGIEEGVISKDTQLNPKGNYGKSKLQAEELIGPLQDENYAVTVLRPPMIYGRGCKGNYPRLAKLALRAPIFPDVANKRSLIYIDNLCEFVRLLVNDCQNGLFLPQNAEYVCTSEMVKMIAAAHGKKIRTTKIFNPIIKRLKISTINKVFGDLVYEINLSGYEGYNAIPFETSIKMTEIV